MARKYLVAEDNEKNIRLIRLIMKQKDVLLIEAMNGEDAVTMAIEEKPDVILMDIQLPRISGIEAMKKLRGKEDFKNTPIIAFTAHAMKGDKEKFIEIGFTGYMSKPINTRTFFDEIEDILKGAN